MPRRNKPTIVLVTGGFDPLHSGHIAMFEQARLFGDMLIVGVNSDEWLTRKKGRPFMDKGERMNIIKHLKMVTQVIDFDDSDDSAIGAIKKVNNLYPQFDIVFANGGDRTIDNIPEMAMEAMMNDQLTFKFGVGGNDKKNSSSWILEDWKTQKTERDWGYWRVLDDKGTIKVKELVIEPGQSLSNQRHEFRQETWHIIKGECKIQFDNVETTVEAKPGDIQVIPKMAWHRAYNDDAAPCHIIEVQAGEKCVEEDIERKE